MKIYYFDVQTGIFQGEDFADESLKVGDYIIPPNATTIAPPPYKPGSQTPFFDPKTQRWELHELQLARTRNNPLADMVL